MSINPNGLILWEGPSAIDDAPIVVIATGIKQGSTNGKTGQMIQTYILRRDMPPQEAISTGADASICGGCAHRGDGTGKERSCYVVIFQGPRGVYMAYKRGSYAKAEFNMDLVELGKDRMVRLGAYGDPAAAPASVWQHLLKFAKGSTGYTHQYRNPAIDATVWAPLVMASADSEQDMHDAHGMGYRTFRVAPIGAEPIKGLEILCPASEEAGRKTTCEDCRACGGTRAKARVSVMIPAHGVGKRYVSVDQ